MTTEQIEQAAQKFADDNESWVPDEQSKGAMYNAFLAGAFFAQSGQGIRWVKASIKPPKAGLYHTDIGPCWFTVWGSWKNKKGMVTKWLDEAAESPSIPVEGVNIEVRKRVKNRLSLYSRHQFSEQDMTAMGFDMFLAGVSFAESPSSPKEGEAVELLEWSQPRFQYNPTVKEWQDRRTLAIYTTEQLYSLFKQRK